LERDLDTHISTTEPKAVRQLDSYDVDTFTCPEVARAIHLFVSQDKAAARSASLGACDDIDLGDAETLATDDALAEGPRQEQCMFASTGDNGSSRRRDAVAAARRGTRWRIPPSTEAALSRGLGPAGHPAKGHVPPREMVFPVDQELIAGSPRSDSVGKQWEDGGLLAPPSAERDSDGELFPSRLLCVGGEAADGTAAADARGTGERGGALQVTLARRGGRPRTGTDGLR
jgi:hypothetical protein